jgi:hypothetical protein
MNRSPRKKSGSIEQTGPFRVLLEDVDIGKTVRESKKRITWQYCTSSNSKATVHEVTLFHSILSGKRKILYNGTCILSHEDIGSRLKELVKVSRSGLLDHAWSSYDGSLLRISVTEKFDGYTYDLFVDNISFSRMLPHPSYTDEGKLSRAKDVGKPSCTAVERTSDSEQVQRESFTDFVTNGVEKKKPKSKKKKRSKGREKDGSHMMTSSFVDVNQQETFENLDVFAEVGTSNVDQWPNMTITGASQGTDFTGWDAFNINASNEGTPHSLKSFGESDFDSGSFFASAPGRADDSRRTSSYWDGSRGPMMAHVQSPGKLCVMGIQTDDSVSQRESTFFPPARCNQVRGTRMASGPNAETEDTVENFFGHSSLDRSLIDLGHLGPTQKKQSTTHSSGYPVPMNVMQPNPPSTVTMRPTQSSILTGKSSFPRNTDARDSKKQDTNRKNPFSDLISL